MYSLKNKTLSIVIFIFLISTLIIGCNSTENSTNNEQSSGDALSAQNFEQTTETKGNQVNKPKSYDAPPSMSIDTSKELYYAKIELEKGGTITLELYSSKVPNTVNNFIFLAKDGFYDGVTFHRVIPGFMAQTGDPTGTGMGGSDLPDIRAEFTRTPFERGTLGMARSQHPDSANSQFFICFQEASFLNNQYTVFGKVKDGMEFIDKIVRGEPPEFPDKIVSIRLSDSN